MPRGQTQGFFAWLERQLGDRAWFNGEAFGWGDLAVAPFVGTSVSVGNAPAEGSALAAWLERVSARPAVAKTLGEARAFDIAGLRRRRAWWPRACSSANTATIAWNG